MSEKSLNKIAQKYDPKPTFPTCSNCAFFKSDWVATGYGDYKAEKNIRCGKGGFAVKKLGTCDHHEKIKI